MTRRLLHVVHYPQFGGPHNQALRLAEPLARRGWELIVVLPDEPGGAAERLRSAGVEVLALPLGRLRSSASPRLHIRFLRDLRRDIARLREEIASRDIELVVIAGLVNPQAAMAARRQGVAVVWQLLDTRAPLALRRALMPLVRARSDVVMSTGRLVAEAHPGAASLGDRLFPFVPPVDVHEFRPDAERRRAARAELGFDESAVVIGTVGNLVPMKGHEVFLDAAAGLRRTAETRFVIFGATHASHAEHAEKLRELADRLGLGDVRFVDPGARVAELLTALDVFWLTSASRSEGIPTAVGEAMAVGVPVVATAVGGVPEVLADRRTGFLVPPNTPEAIAAATCRLLADRDLARRMGEDARDQAVRLFAVEACADVHAVAFARALEWRAGGR